MRIALALVMVAGCASDNGGENGNTLDTIEGTYTVHREATNYEACPPYEAPMDFALEIAGDCVMSPVAGSTCEPIDATGTIEFTLSERWDGGPGVPSDYPPYAITTVNYSLQRSGDLLTGTAAGSYSVHGETMFDDCSYTWNVTVSPN